MDVVDRREDRGAARGEVAAGGAAVAGVGASAEGAEADGGTVGAAAVAAEGAAASAGCCTCGIDVTAPVRLRREPPALFSRVNSSWLGNVGGGAPSWLRCAVRAPSWVLARERRLEPVGGARSGRM